VKLALCALLVCALAAGAGRAAPEPIRLGATGPTATEAGAPLRGLSAYLRWANAHGGAGGRPIALTLLDDGGDPDRAAADATQLDASGGLALVAVGGAATSEAIRAATPIPQLLSVSGAVPGALAPSDTAQGAVFARRIVGADPGARVAVVFAGTAEGRALAAGLRRGLGRKVVASVRFDPEAAASNQVGALRTSGADALCVLGLGSATRAVLAATRSWHPATYVDGASAWAAPLGAAEGVVTEVWARGALAPVPGDPADALVEAVAGPAHARDPGFVEGLAIGYALVDALRAAGPDPTRPAVVRATAGLAEPSNPFLLPGVGVRPAAGAATAVGHLQLVQRRGGSWIRLGGLQAAG
jgi:branched-chain amino acid transport system substrate-binding protein